jgi:hypothetical protein
LRNALKFRNATDAITVENELSKRRNATSRCLHRTDARSFGVWKPVTSTITARMRRQRDAVPRVTAPPSPSTVLGP